MSLARIGSLFSGIGGLELGLERAGVGRTVWQCERDPYCLSVLERHWPEVRRFADVETLEAPDCDVLCGGFPCQDLSYAGSGAGLRGARSGLWHHFARVIRDIRPQYVVVENVPALLGRGLDVVLGDLAACGYDAEWDCVSAAAVGAPHRRDRLFIIAHANGARLEERESQPGDARAQLQAAERGGAANGGAEAVADAHGERELQPEGSVPQLRRWPLHGGREGGGHWSAEPDVGRVADGVPARVDRIRGLGNAVVPQVAEVVGRRILDLQRGAA